MPMLRKFIKENDFSELLPQPVACVIAEIGLYQRCVHYLPLQGKLKPLLTEYQSQKLSRRQNKIMGFSVYGLGNRLHIAIVENQFIGNSFDLAYRLKTINDVQCTAIRHAGRNLLLVSTNNNPEVLAHIFYHIHDLWVLDADTIASLSGALAFSPRPTIDDLRLMLRQEKFDAVLAHLLQAQDARLSFKVGKYCRRYCKDKWHIAIQCFLTAPANSIDKDFDEICAYTAAVRSMGEAIQQGKPIEGNIFEKIMFERALLVCVNDRPSDNTIWSLGICCEYLFDDKRNAIQCFQQILPSDKHYEQANDKLFHLSLNDPSVPDETKFAYAMTGGKDNMVNENIYFQKLSGNTSLGDIFQNTKPDTDTLIRLATCIRELQSENILLKADNKRYKSILDENVKDDAPQQSSSHQLFGSK
jgi:hypothetical protein